MFFFLLVHLAVIRTSLGVYMNSGLYEGVTVALSTDILQTECQTVVENIKDVFNEASSLMFDATSGLEFGSLVIIVNDEWTKCGSLIITDVFASAPNADMKVGLQHPIFGDQPLTQQSKGCGLGGDFMYFSKQWLETDEDKGRRLLHEWAKYRWGAFEEYGHVGDEIFPPSYRISDSTFTPNYCTDVALSGEFPSTCTDEANCIFEIGSTGNADVRSSLMSVPHLNKTTEFCTNNNHVTDAVTKHNLLCDQKSVWEVISQHSDFDNINIYGRPTAARDVDVKIVKSSSYPSLVISYEFTSAMDDIRNRWQFETDAIAQLIAYELPDNLNVGLVTFDGSDISIRSNPITLDSGTRTVLTEKIFDQQGPQSNSNERELNEIIKLSTDAFVGGQGIILLLTRCLDSDDAEDADDLIAAADGNAVWSILYPYEESCKHLGTFQELASVTGGEVIYIEDVIQSESDDIDTYLTTTVRQRLSEALRQILHQDSEVDVQMIDSFTSVGRSYDVQLFTNNAYETDQIIYIYYDSAMSSNGVIVDENIVVENGECFVQPLEPDVRSTLVIKCELEEEDSVSFTVYSWTTAFIFEGELVGKPKSVSNSAAISVWGSSNIFNMQYTSTSAPALYAQLSHQDRRIVYANVTGIVKPKNDDDDGDTYTILFNDAGTAADVTGNDGVYSAYILPIQDIGQADISIIVSNEGGKAKLHPKDYDSNDEDAVICCGSSIPLPTTLDEADTLPTGTTMSIEITETYTGNLPPGTIRDLKLSERSDGLVLTFTAPGGDLDYGKAHHYILTEYTEVDEDEDGTETDLEDTPSTAGTQETITINSVTCSSIYIITVTAVDDAAMRGSASNRASLDVSCSGGSGSGSGGTGDDSLSTGAIVGIVLGCILFIVLIILLIYCCSKDKYGNKRSGKHSKLTSCSCCKNEKKTKTSTKRHSIEVIRNPPVTQIRSVHDLHGYNSNLSLTATDSMNPTLMNAESGTIRIGTYSNLETRSPPSSPGEGYPSPRTVVPSSPPHEDHLTDAFTYSVNLAHARSQGSLHSVSTESLRPVNVNMGVSYKPNEIGVPVLPPSGPPRIPSPRIPNYHYEVRAEPLPKRAPMVPPKYVPHNTEV